MLNQPNRNSPWPPIMTDLNLGERLVVWAFRCRASGAEYWPLVQAEFSQCFGPHVAARAMCAFEDFVDSIRSAACRDLSYHAPCCPCVGQDEMCVATLVATSQERDCGLSHIVACCLVLPDCVERAAAAARTLGDVLARQGLALPNRLRQARCFAAPAMAQAASPRVLH